MDWKALKSDIIKKTNIIIEDDKKEKIDAFLLKKFSSSSLSDAYDKITSSLILPDDFVDLITVNETFFFRHPQQFEELKKFLPETSEPLNILSVGCSSGEEPYSLAIWLSSQSINYSITGVDISRRIINIAKAGIYSTAVIDRTAPEYKNLLLSASCDFYENSTSKFKIKNEIMENVHFLCGNIFSIHLRKYDAILCRNILIYFSEADRIKLLRRLSYFLKPSGILVLGAGELLPIETIEELQNISGYSYRKVA